MGATAAVWDAVCSREASVAPQWRASTCAYSGYSSRSPATQPIDEQLVCEEGPAGKRATRSQCMKVVECSEWGRPRHHCGCRRFEGAEQTELLGWY